MAETIEGLTKDLLSRVEGLTDEQVNQILTLSDNVLEKAIGKATGKTHGLYDTAFEQLLGEKKPQGVFSTEHWVERMKQFKDKATEAGGELQKQLEALRAEKASLEEQVKNGKGAEALKQQLLDNEHLVKKLRDKLEETKKEWEGKLQKAHEQNTALQFDHEFDKALRKFKFKNDNIIPSDVKDTFIEGEKLKILNEYESKWKEGDKNKQLLFYRDGEIARHPETVAPLTMQDLLTKALAPILDTGKQAAGAGTGDGPDNGRQALASIGSAKTQPEAAEAITQELLKRGLAQGTKEHQAEFDKAWTENNVSSLPIR